MEIQSVVKLTNDREARLKGRMAAYKLALDNSLTKEQLTQYVSEGNFQNTSEYMSLSPDLLASYIEGFKEGIVTILADMDDESCELSDHLRSRKYTYATDGALIAIEFARSNSFDINSIKSELEDNEQDLEEFLQTGKPHRYSPGSSVRYAKDGYIHELKHLLNFF